LGVTLRLGNDRAWMVPGIALVWEAVEQPLLLLILALLVLLDRLLHPLFGELLEPAVAGEAEGVEQRVVIVAVFIAGQEAEQTLTQHLDPLVMGQRLAVFLTWIIMRLLAQTRGHLCGVVPATVELGDGQQNGIASDLADTGLDNDPKVWDKIEVQLLGILRRHTRPPCLDLTVHGRVN
jgi:hypothetical protein